MTQTDGKNKTDIDVSEEKKNGSAQEQTQDARVKELDLRGVFCPLSLIRTKMALKELSIGDVLKVTLDKFDAVEDMPQAIQKEGQKVLGVKQVGEKDYEVSIQKAK